MKNRITGLCWCCLLAECKKVFFCCLTLPPPKLSAAGQAGEAAEKTSLNRKPRTKKTENSLQTA